MSFFYVAQVDGAPPGRLRRKYHAADSLGACMFWWHSVAFYVTSWHCSNFAPHSRSVSGLMVWRSELSFSLRAMWLPVWLLGAVACFGEHSWLASLECARVYSVVPLSFGWHLGAGLGVCARWCMATISTCSEHSSRILRLRPGGKSNPAHFHGLWLPGIKVHPGLLSRALAF